MRGRLALPCALACAAVAVACDAGPRPLLADARFVAAGTPHPGYEVVSDLAVYRDRLYLVASKEPGRQPGAAVVSTGDGTHFADALARPESQELLRLRVVDGRLLVPDADPPGGEPGYVFASADGTAFSESLLPDVFHTYDVLPFRGELVAANGTRHRGGALLTSPARGDPVWRGAFATSLSRLRFLATAGGALFVATEPNPRGVDYLRWEADPEAGPPREVDAVPGAAITFRWYVSSRGRLFWSHLDADGMHLRYSDDGRRWISVPELDQLFVSDLAELDGNLYALTHRGLFGSRDHTHFELVAPTPDPRAFAVVLVPPGDTPEARARANGNSDAMGSLEAWHGRLWAGATHGGTLYRVEAPRG